jgi:hypothetical protein
MSNYQLQARSPLEILMGLTPFDAARLGHGFYMGSLGRPVEPALFPSAIPPSTSPATKPSSGGPPYPPGTPGSAAPQDLPVTPHWGTRPSSPVSAQLRRRAEPRILKGNDDAI